MQVRKVKPVSHPSNTAKQSPRPTILTSDVLIRSPSPREPRPGEVLARTQFIRQQPPLAQEQHQETVTEPISHRAPPLRPQLLTRQQGKPSGMTHLETSRATRTGRRAYGAQVLKNQSISHLPIRARLPNPSHAPPEKENGRSVLS